jgi:hypothetical protein
LAKPFLWRFRYFELRQKVLDNEALMMQYIERLTTLLRDPQPDFPTSRKPELVVQTGHTLTSELAFSPDGRLLVTAGKTGW